MPQSYGDFHNEHRLHNSYASSISTNVSENRPFGSNSRGLRPTHPLRLPQPIEVEFRNYPPLLSSNSVGWDGLALPNYGYTETINQFRSAQDPIDVPVRSGTQDPLLNWYTNNDGPWIPRGTVPDIPMDHAQSRSQPPGFRMNTPVPPGPNQLRETNLSEKGDTPLVYLPSDSGYGTRRSFENASVFSSDLLDRNHDGPSLTSQGHETQPFSTQKVSGHPNESEISESWAGSQPASSGNQNQSDLQCTICSKCVKTKSELKKHDLRHKKPFHCSHPGCGRKEGFSTSNDLDRHTRSKHPTDLPRTPSKVYRCVVPQCKSQSKPWPRLDNFRCHIKRVHQLSGEALEDLVRLSEQRGRSRDVRDEQRDIQHRQFLPDLTNLDKVPGAHFRSEEPDDDLGEVYDRSETVKSSNILKSPHHMTFQPTVYKPDENNPISEHSFTHDRMEIDSDSNHIEGQRGDVLFKDRSFPATDSERLGHLRTLGLSSEIRDEVLGNLRDPAVTEVLTAALAHAKIAEPTISNKELLKSRIEKAAIRERSLVTAHPPLGDRKSFPSQSMSLSDQEVPRIGSLHDVDQFTKALEIIKALGYRVHKDPSAGESRGEHPKEYPTPEASEPEPNIPHSGIKSEPLICTICSKFLDRPCKMKKHMKRHERPYGCTFPNCGKQFGSKNDWKRHENSQHFQLETWRCDEEKPPRSPSISFPPNPPCAKVCYRKESFKEHLIKEHRISDLTEVKDKLEICRIGRNCQSRFWCGFCKGLKDLKKRGVEAWTERFNHIDDHFMGRNGFKNQSIKEWIAVDGEESSTTQYEHKSPEIVVLDDEDETDSPPSTSPSQDGDRRSKTTNNNVIFNAVDWNSQGETRKRQNESDDTDSGRPLKTVRRSMLTKRIICCQCQSSHNPAVIGVGCTVCEDNHRFCDSCFFAEADPWPRGSDR